MIYQEIFIILDFLKDKNADGRPDYLEALKDVRELVEAKSVENMEKALAYLDKSIDNYTARLKKEHDND